ncbi:hypothetical protein BD289DRAFT_36978 [Coniella lustricola]|uniref:Uncharacterized protein n=1 Tax=Coniella lustricola TaxID=2025994 RepID=A0A2T3AIM5_9PEZI|nr:hypothetical protein BD289DRAFT_36978 [Coniella lustricola]
MTPPRKGGLLINRLVISGDAGKEGSVPLSNNTIGWIRRAKEGRRRAQGAPAEVWLVQVAQPKQASRRQKPKANASKVYVGYRSPSSSLGVESREGGQAGAPHSTARLAVDESLG